MKGVVLLNSMCQDAPGMDKHSARPQVSERDTVQGIRGLWTHLQVVRREGTNALKSL